MAEDKELLTEKDLVQKCKECERVFVLFYASWCPYSREFLPVFKEHSKDKTRTYARFRIEENESVARKNSIDVYPSVLFFIKGAVVERLDGEEHVGLDEDKLVEFIKKCDKAG